MTMQITLTLDDDLALALQEEVKRSGRPLKETIDALLRRELRPPARDRSTKPFRVRPRHMGNPPPDLDIDNIGELLDRIEGPSRR